MTSEGRTPSPGDACPVCPYPDGVLVDFQRNGVLDCNLCGYDTASEGRSASGHRLDCECDGCNEAAHNLPCTDCDCCASGDCEALFCTDCPCTSAVSAPARGSS